MNHAVWDIDTGFILKLVEGNRISHAMHGFESLSQDAIRQHYGNPPLFNSMHYPTTNKLIDAKKGAYWVL
jgi:hypothetical protein